MQCHGEKILSGPSFVSKAFTETILQEHCCSRRGGGAQEEHQSQCSFSSKGSRHEHQQAEAEGEHSEQHQNFQINATWCLFQISWEWQWPEEKGQEARAFPTEWSPSLTVETTVPTGKWAKGSPCLAFPIMYTGQEDSHLLWFFSRLVSFFRHLVGLLLNMKRKKVDSQL